MDSFQFLMILIQVLNHFTVWRKCILWVHVAFSNISHFEHMSRFNDYNSASENVDHNICAQTWHLAVSAVGQRQGYELAVPMYVFIENLNS